MRFIVLGDYRYDVRRGLERVPYDDLDRVFTGQGAAQFCNAISPTTPPDVEQNVALVRVSDRRWTIPAGQPLGDATEALFRQWPGAQGREVILFALTDVEAGTELIAAYGEGYFQQAALRRRLNPTPVQASLLGGLREPLRERPPSCVVCGLHAPLYVCDWGEEGTRLYCSVDCQRSDRPW